MVRSLLVVGVVVLLGGCAVPEQTVGGAAERPTVSADPLATDDNRTACTAARREVGSRAKVFADVGNGVALPADAAKAAQKLQAKMDGLASFSSGEVRLQLLRLSDAYGRMRVNLTVLDVKGLQSAVAEQNAALDSLGGLCDRIGA